MFESEREYVICRSATAVELTTFPTTWVTHSTAVYETEGGCFAVHWLVVAFHFIGLGYIYIGVFVRCISVLELATSEPHIGTAKIIGVKSYM